MRTLTKPDYWTRRADAKIALALAIFALFFRLATLMMIHTGVDERDYWFSAKAIALGLPYPELSHRTVRFAVILPVAGAQLVLGESPNVYYVLPVLNSMLQAALAYLIGSKARGRLAGLFASLGLILFPYMIRSASQVRPEVFSLTYVLAALWCFLAYLDDGKRRRLGLAGSALFFFAAYESKITNLFFLPGLLAVMLARKKPFRDIALFGGILLGLFLVETGLYAAFTEYRFGQLQVIERNHLEGNSALVAMGFLDLFKRYAEPYLQAYWQATFLLFAAAAVYYAAKKSEAPQRALAVAAISFFVFVTFAVKSLDPVVPMEPFINRYFCAVLGPVFLVLGSAFQDLAERFLPSATKKLKAMKPRAFAALLASGALVIVLLFSAGVLPAGAREYAHSLARPSEHPLALNARYRAEVDKAFAEGVPIVAVPGVAGENALMSCSSYYLSPRYLTGGRRPGLGRAEIGGAELAVLRSGSGGGAGEVLAAVRDPFRLRTLPASSLGALESDAFPR